jgi:hypothetical protein
VPEAVLQREAIGKRGSNQPEGNTQGDEEKQIFGWLMRSGHFDVELEHERETSAN